jgi:hypothetical protein
MDFYNKLLIFVAKNNHKNEIGNTIWKQFCKRMFHLNQIVCYKIELNLYY